MALCPNGSPCKLMNLAGRERCACEDGAPSINYGCGVGGLGLPITEYLDIAKNLDATIIGIDEGGTSVTSVTKKNFDKFLTSILTNSEIGKSEVVTENQQKFLLTGVKLNGLESAVYSKLRFIKGNSYAVVQSVSIVCMGKCPDNGGPCIGYIDYFGDRKYKCRCSTKCSFRFLVLPSGPSDPVYMGPILAENNWR